MVSQLPGCHHRRPPMPPPTAIRGRKTTPSQRQTLALCGQASAMVLTKLGEHDLAWIASERGLNAAQDADDPGNHSDHSNRSMVHTLQSHGRTDASTTLAQHTSRRRPSAGNSRRRTPPGGRPIYGTLLLAASMAAARAGDRSDRRRAPGRGRPPRHPARSRCQPPLDRLRTYQRRRPPSRHGGRPGRHRQRRTIHLASIDCVGPARLNAASAIYSMSPRSPSSRDRTDEAIATMLEAEQLGPEQVHNHVMAQQIVAHLRRLVVRPSRPAVGLNSIVAPVKARAAP